MGKKTFVISGSPEERLAKLDEYFHLYLATWVHDVMAGVEYTPAIAEALARSLADVSATTLISTSAGAADESDEVTAARCLRAGEAAIEAIRRVMAE